MGQRNFKKPFEFHNSSEILYCGMTRPRNTNLGVFIQHQYTRIVLRNIFFKFIIFTLFSI